jgi:hypothetical protein
MLAVPLHAQRGGGDHGAGTSGGGGSRGGGFGGGSRGSGFGNGFGNFFGGGFCGGIGGFGGGFGGFHGSFNRSGFKNGFGFNNGFGLNNGFGCGGVGIGNWGFGDWGWGSLDYPYDWGFGYPYDRGYASPTRYSVPAQQSSPAVNIISATPPGPAYAERARPVIHEYDYGQPAQQPSGVAASPIYLIAFQTDHAIRAAASYWVDGQTLHYVTQQHEEKVAPLSSIDRALTLQLNRERSVAFQLP